MAPLPWPLRAALGVLAGLVLLLVVGIGRAVGFIRRRRPEDRDGHDYYGIR